MARKKKKEEWEIVLDKVDKMVDSQCDEVRDSGAMWMPQLLELIYRRLCYIHYDVARLAHGEYDEKEKE